MFTMTPTWSYLPFHIHRIVIEKDSALFEPNAEDVRSLERVRIKLKKNQERDNLVMQKLKNTIAKVDKR